MLTIEGEKYSGTFRANRRTGDFWVGSEYTEAKYSGYWYEGTGFVVDKSEGGKHWFAFETPHFRSWDDPKSEYSLEEAIVNFNPQRPYYVGDYEPRLVESAFPKVADICLEAILTQTRATRADIPLVRTVLLDANDLVRHGLSIGRVGELYLPLG